MHGSIQDNLVTVVGGLIFNMILKNVSHRRFANVTRGFFWVYI